MAGEVEGLFWLVEEHVLRAMLQRVANGESVDVVMMEAFANGTPASAEVEWESDE